MLDDDFFELDEDLLNATNYCDDQLVSTNEETSDTFHISSFNCTGEDNLSSHNFHADSFIRNNEIKKFDNKIKKFAGQQPLFDLNISQDVLIDSQILHCLINKSRTNIQMLMVSSRENSSFLTRKNFYVLRHQVTEVLFQLRQILYAGKIKYCAAEQLLKPLSNYLECLCSLSIFDIVHSVYSTNGNESISPAHHLLHGHLEWRWLYLTTMFKIQQEKNDFNQILTLKNTVFEEQLKLFIYDLIIASVTKFNKLNLTEIPAKSPFICSCIKESWLMLQLFVEKFNDYGNHLNFFWSYFNEMLKFVRDGKNPYDSINREGVNYKIAKIMPNNLHLFSAWILRGVAVLHGFTEDGQFNAALNPRIKDNTEFLENLVKTFINADPTEENLRVFLLIIKSLLTEWWTPKADIVMTFWEFFHKKLNSSFYVSGSAPKALAITSNTATGYLEQINKRVENDSINADNSSFSIFINLLGKLLRRFVQLDLKNQIQKAMGRIFTKFSESKLYALNELGIHNLLTLFLTLAVTTELKEVGQRLQNILLQMRLEKLQPARQTCLTKGHVALLILHSNENLDIHGYVLRFMEQVHAINSDENKLPILKILIDGAETLFQKNNPFECGEYLLLDSWLSDYLSFASQSEQEKCYRFANVVLTTPRPAEEFMEKYVRLIQAIYKYVLPHIKNVYRQSNVFSIVPDVAATFCLYANGVNGLPNFDELFKYFTEISCADIQITVKYLVSILSTKKIDKIEQISIIRMWIKCSMLTTNSNEDIIQLTKIVMKLSKFKAVCNKDEGEFIAAKEPLSLFFGGCSKSYEDATEPEKRIIAEILQNAIIGFEKWVPISETPQYVFKVYIIIGLIIFHCAPIVYIRSKPTCFFNVAMNHYILPLPLLMEKQQKPITIQAINKVWQLIVGGIEKIDFNSDPNLQKNLTDLIVKWIPQFRLLPNQKLVSKPFVTCMSHSQPSTIKFILDKMVTNFLSAQRRETHQNAPIVMTILKDILTSVINDCEKLGILLNSVLFTLLEHAMMVDDSLPSKKLIFEFLTDLASSATFKNTSDLRNIVQSNLKTLTTKHLSYYSSVYYQLMLKLIRISPSLVRDILCHLREQLTVVEELRGAGPDAKLRNSQKQLEEVLRSYT